MRIISAALLFVSFACQPLKAENDAKIIRETLKVSVDEILSVLRRDDLNLAAKKEKVTAAAMPLFDVPLMAKLILGREHWSKLKPKDQDRFTERFIKLMQASYFDKVDLLSDEKVEYDEPVANKGKYSVMTYVVTKDQRVKILYKFYKSKDSEHAKQPWKVYDVEIEGISIVKSYGTQYDEFLKEGTFENLLVKMQEKIEGFDKKLDETKSTKGTSGKEISSSQPVEESTPTPKN